MCGLLAQVSLYHCVNRLHAILLLTNWWVEDSGHDTQEKETSIRRNVAVSRPGWIPIPIPIPIRGMLPVHSIPIPKALTISTLFPPIRSRTLLPSVPLALCRLALVEL